VASTESEATSRGAALLALRSLGLIQTLDEVPAATGAIYEPDSLRHTIYREAIVRQQWLYERVIGREGE
jgi:gluconokinase